MKIAGAAGMRLLGPNSMGVINAAQGVGLTVNAALDVDRLLPGRLMGNSQSGSMVGTMISRGAARGVGFSALVSVGNEADLTVGDIGLAAVDDPGVDAFLLFMETIRKPEAMAAFAGRARAAGKPIIVYKLGRSDAARELAVSHTGALTGSDAAADAFFRAHGMIRVDQFETLIEAPPLLIQGAGGARGARRAIRRDRPVAVITTTGGGGAMVVDRLGMLGIAVAAGSEALRAGLRDVGVTLGPGRLTDVTLAGARYESMLAVLDRFVASGEFSVVVAAIGSSAQFRPELAVQPIIDVDKTATPVVGFMVPQADQALLSLGAAGIAGFRTAESCAEAIRGLLETRPSPPFPSSGPTPPFSLAASPDANPPVTLPTGLPPGAQSELNSLAIMRSLGVTTTETTVIRSDEPVPDRLAYPVVAKVLSADVPHKTESGGVILGIADAGGLKAAIQTIYQSVSSAHPEAEIDGVCVQPMVSGLAEALIGLTNDPEVGPVITLATGGVMAEIYRDTAVRLAPVGAVEARDMIAAVKGLAPVRGYRGLPKGDLDALAAAIVALSGLASVGNGAVLEAEINPLIIRAEGAGVIAVDGLVVLGSGTT